MRTLPSLLLIASAALLTLGSTLPVASSDSEPARLVRILDLGKVGVSRPTGLGFSHQEGALLVLHVAGESTTSGASEVVTISPFVDFLDSRPVALEVTDSSTLLYDTGTHQLSLTGAEADGWIRDELSSTTLSEPFQIADIDSLPSALQDALAIAYHPVTGHVHVLTSDQRLHELTAAGDYVTARDLSALGLSDPRGMVFAPSGDTTDDPA